MVLMVFIGSVTESDDKGTLEKVDLFGYYLRRYNLEHTFSNLLQHCFTILTRLIPQSFSKFGIFNVYEIYKKFPSACSIL